MQTVYKLKHPSTEVLTRCYQC